MHARGGKTYFYIYLFYSIIFNLIKTRKYFGGKHILLVLERFKYLVKSC